MSGKVKVDLHERIGYKLALAARINDQLLDRELASIGITRQMWCLLVATGAQQITQPSAIASYIGINRTAVSRTLRDMEARGYLVRGHGNNDGRSKEVALTQKGQQLLKRSLPIVEGSAATMDEKLSKHDQKELHRLLDKFLSDQSVKPSSI